MLLAAWYLEAICTGAFVRVKKAEEKARYLYQHDALTGINTRHAFSEKLKKMLEKSHNVTTSAIMLDVDNFKKVNDRYGHNGGDAVLKAVARIITENTCDDCIYCRWGGEEFLILMQCHHDSFEIAEQIRKITENTSIFYEDKEIHITISLGLTTTDSLTEEQIDEFIKCADNAMYTSKSQGKNQTTYKNLKLKQNNQLENKKSNPIFKRYTLKNRVFIFNSPV